MPEEFAENTIVERTVTRRVVDGKMEETVTVERFRGRPGGSPGVRAGSGAAVAPMNLKEQRKNTSGKFRRWKDIKDKRNGFEADFPDLPDKDAVRARSLGENIGPFSLELAEILFRPQTFLNDEHGAEDPCDHWFPKIKPTSPVTLLFSYSPSLRVTEESTDPGSIEVMRKRACIQTWLPVVPTTLALEWLSRSREAQTGIEKALGVKPGGLFPAVADGPGLLAVGADRTLRLNALVESVAKEGYLDLVFRPGKGLVTLHHHLPYDQDVIRFLLFFNVVCPDFLPAILNARVKEDIDNMEDPDKPRRVRYHYPPTINPPKWPPFFQLPQSNTKGAVGNDLNRYRFILDSFGKIKETGGKEAYSTSLQDTTPQIVQSCAVSFGEYEEVEEVEVIDMESVVCIPWDTDDEPEDPDNP